MTDQCAIPEGFTPVSVATPRHDRAVLAIRVAASGSSQFEVLTAAHQPDYRPLNPWRTLSNDAVTDSGNEVLGWREMPEWLNPPR